MSLAFYMDEHMPKAITIDLRARGVDVLTAQEVGPRETDDPMLLDRARELGRVRVSFDVDMLRLARQWQQHGIKFAGIIFAHPRQISVGECVRDIEIMAKAGNSEDLKNQILYLPL